MSLVRGRLLADAILDRAARAAPIVASVTPDNAASERTRVLAALGRGEQDEPRFVYTPRPVDAGIDAQLAAIARGRGGTAVDEALRRRAEELRLQMRLCAAVGQPRQMRATSVALWGSARQVVEGRRLLDVALDWLRERGAPEPRTIPPEPPRPGCRSLRGDLECAARRLGLTVRVHVHARLSAAAAVSGGAVLLGGGRWYSEQESVRLCAHEVGFHLAAFHRARRLPLRLLSTGTAGFLADHEGAALMCEVESGAFTAYRRRLIGARVFAVDAMLQGASFSETLSTLREGYDLDATDAYYACERAFRGDGFTKDVVYLRGFLRVSAAREQGEPIGFLNLGKIGLDDRAVASELLAATGVPEREPPLGVSDTTAEPPI